ncbi:hypothetical protein vseg_009875 [Gypsophila vaccaria]
MAFGKTTSKSRLLVVIAWIILQSSALRAATIQLDLTSRNKDDYKNFLSDIRKNVKDPSLKYGGTDIPVIGKPSGTFLRINLKYSSTGTVSLGLLRNDLYVVAYLAKDEKAKSVAYSFKNVITTGQLDALFPEAKGKTNQKTITEYDESYKSLEKAAKQSRKQAGLGIEKLVKYIQQVDGKARKVQNEATFIMVAIQMVSEATRFVYIENLVRNTFPKGFTPDDRVIIFERNWKRASEAIKGSTNGAFATTLVLTSEGITTEIRANNAAQLEMGLLKYLG